jgi:hypothetical protein
VSRSAGPYTMAPPVDYDGLSWPSLAPPQLTQGATR